MKIGEFLKPSKGRIITALAIPYIWTGLIMLYYSTQNIQTALISPSSMPLFIVTSVLSFLIDSVFYYPLSCSISLIFTSIKKNHLNKLSKDRMLLAVLILSILFFNPLVLTIISNLLYYS